MDRRLHAGPAAPVRAVAGFDRLPFGQSPLRAGLEACALHLVRDDGAVRRLRDHAFRAAHPFRRHNGTPLGRAGCCRSGVPTRGRRSSHCSDSGIGAGHRSRPRAREAARCRPFVRHVARGHGHQCGRLRLASETFQRGSTDTGRAGRRGRNDGSQLRCALEARAAHFDKGCLGAGACNLPRRVERLCDDGPHPPAAHRDRARHRRFQHAGHSA